MPRARVLLAEDDPQLREILCEGLADLGFDVVAAEDGRKALEMFQAGGRYDVLLLDEEMPHLTGRQFLSRVRQAGSRVRAIMISGNVDVPEDERALLGIERVMRKPASIDEIGAALRDPGEHAPSEGDEA